MAMGLAEALLVIDLRMLRAFPGAGPRAALRGPV